METTQKSLAEAAINYMVETNKQMYDFGLKMANDYVEFSKTTMKMMPGMEAWTNFIPATKKK